VTIPFLLLGIGAAGYKTFGGPEWTWGDALYMSGITLTTVGYGETHPLDASGRVFTVVFLFVGVFVLFYTATEIIRAIVSGQLKATLGREGVRHALEEIRDHIVVCGLGRMGRLICHEFERQKAKYVVVDMDEALLEERAREHGIPVHGDATADEVLKQAGIERAKVLVAVLPSDADNLYITLSARVLNPNLFIVARAEQESSEPKLRRVGANQVVSPYVIGGHRVAQAVLRPTVGHFIEQATRPGPHAYQIEEVVIQAKSPLCGKTLRETDLGQKVGVVVLTMRRTDGEMVFNPKGDTVIEAGSIVVVVGLREQLEELDQLAAGRK
jgi:voltage-gated potassium channel